MKPINLVPGSPEWIKSRSASKAPAVMGASKYQSRSDLLKVMATGITKDVDAATQARFDAGHASEAAAREIAEDIVCDGLSPVCGESDDGYLTASFDGLTFDGRIGYEHKLWNESLATAVSTNDLPEEYKWQMDQHILVGGLEYVLFMVSDGTREKCVSMEYRSTSERAAALIAAWRMFDADLAAYQHTEAAPEVVAAPQMALPALSIQVSGSISLIDNLEIFGAKLGAFIAGLPENPATDQEFADADAAVKTLKTAEEALDAAESSALAQTASIDQMRRTVGLYRDQARTARLMLDKLVKARKESIRVEIVLEASTKLAEHIADLNKRIGKPYMPAAHGDFSGAIKGMKKVLTLRDACDAELARCKIEANVIADKISINLASLRELAADHAFLFADTQALVTGKANDDLVLLIKSRISDHKATEAKKLEAIKESARIEAEKNAEAKIKAEQESLAAEALASVKAASPMLQAIIEPAPQQTAQPAPVVDSRPISPPVRDAATRPTDCQIVEVLALHYRVHESKVIEWLLDMDIDKQSVNLAGAM